MWKYVNDTMDRSEEKREVPRLSGTVVFSNMSD